MRELEIYVHIPFCVRKCAYCDFLSFTAEEKVRSRYTEELLREIESGKDRGDMIVPSVFIGGGTPSMLEGHDICRVAEALKKNYSFSEDAEITIEANPGTLTEEKLRLYKEAGINRLSLGLQSAQNEELKALGRIHTYEDFLESFYLARNAGFSNINIDLMSGLPGQTEEKWQDTLQKVLSLAPEHISAYGLIIEEETPFYKRYGEDAARRERGEETVFLPSEETERRMYVRTKELLQEHGYHRYEISNYSRKGYECRHNAGYWRRKEYRGFGLGASSFTGQRRYANTRNMNQYLSGQWKGKEEICLSREEQMEEVMFLGLRMTKGVSKEEFAREFGASIEEIYGSVLARMEKNGLMREENDRIMLTEKGIDISNYVMAEFLLT